MIPIILFVLCGVLRADEARPPMPPGEADAPVPVQTVTTLIAEPPDTLDGAQDRLFKAARDGSRARETIKAEAFRAHQAYLRAESILTQPINELPLPPLTLPTVIRPRVAASTVTSHTVPPPARETFEPTPSEEVKPALTLPLYVSGDVGQSIKIPAKTNGSEVRWYAIDAGLNLFPVELLRSSLTAVVSSQKPGSYRVLGYTAIGGQVSDVAICTVNVIGPEQQPVPPQPVPDPVRPIPPPQPTPPVVTASKVVVVIVDDAVRRTPANAALIADLGYWESLEKQVAHVHVVPAASELARQYASQIATAGGIPCMILMDSKTNKVLTAVKLPSGKVEATAIISQFTGGK